jgi:hypothetical protein
VRSFDLRKKCDSRRGTMILKNSPSFALSNNLIGALLYCIDITQNCSHYIDGLSNLVALNNLKIYFQAQGLDSVRQGGQGEHTFVVRYDLLGSVP